METEELFVVESTWDTKIKFTDKLKEAIKGKAKIRLLQGNEILDPDDEIYFADGTMENVSVYGLITDKEDCVLSLLKHLITINKPVKGIFRRYIE